AMSERAQKEFIDKALDSLSVDGMSQKRISITVDDNDNRLRDNVRIRAWNRDDDEPMIWSWRDGDGHHQNFHFDTKELQGSVRRMQKEMEPKLRELRANVEPSIRIMQKNIEGMGDRFNGAWGSAFDNSSSVRSLNAYANNPDNGLLNLRFSVPEKGDVRITVTDTDGKEVGKKTIKDFSGEFVGQIELKKNTKGTLFVTVVQNDDGTMRKVVIE
ncbi:T9SS type A sorting domain-containing protein, partial [Persicitalea sp.]|uniref:T9SS type A sorting domain-containing protein n=1 Tax=Persicitalea sp. TaxID=3100273 RepID=UPI003594081B